MKPWILALAGTLAQPTPAEPSVRETFRQEQYRFCHEKDYPLLPKEHEFCPLVGPSSDVCPVLPKACEAPAVEHVGHRDRSEFFGRRRLSLRRHAGDGPATRSPGEDGRTHPDPEVAVPAPTSGLSFLAQGLFVLCIAAIVVFVGREIARNLLRGRGQDPKGEEEDREPAGADATPARPTDPVETDVARLLARARDAASRGDYGRALDDLYAALLRRLDGDGLIEIHASRTNGDYARMLRDKPNVLGIARGVFRDVERVQFGATAPSADLFCSVLDRVVPFVSRTVPLLVLGFIAATQLSCGTNGKSTHTESAVHGDSSPSGTTALVDLLNKNAFSAKYRSASVTKLDRALTLVLLPDAELDANEWTSVLSWVRDKGGNLVLTDASHGPPEINLTAKVDTQKSTTLTTSDSSLVVTTPPGLKLTSRKESEPLSEALVVLARRGDSDIIVDQPYGSGRIVAFADPRMVTNISLVTANNATFLLRVFSRVVSSMEVELVDEWTGTGAENPFESVHRAELTPLILQLLALLVVLFLWRGTPFAKLRDPRAVSRRSFADHARALGIAYARARASRHAEGLFAVWAVDRLRERVRAGGRTGLIPLAEAISARTGQKEAEVVAVLAEAMSAREEAAPPSRTTRAPFSAPFGRRAPDEATSDFALLEALRGFLAASGQRFERSNSQRHESGESSPRS